MTNINKKIVLRRKNKLTAQLVCFINEPNNAWYIVKNEGVAIGFKYDIKNDNIVECTDREQVYHSYLPTFDKVIYPVKINADFSTDPSRKHITVDEKTEKAIISVAKMLGEIISSALNGQLHKEFKNIFRILNSKGSFSRCNSLLQQEIKKYVLDKCIIKINQGNLIRIEEYKLLPDWLEEAEKFYLRKHSKYVSNASILMEVYETFDEVDIFVKQYSQVQFSNEDVIEVMKEEAVVEKMIPETQGKIIGKIIKSEKFSQSISKEKRDLSEVKILTEDGVKNIHDISNSEVKVNETVRAILSNNANSAEIEWFVKQNSIKKSQIEGYEREVVHTKIQLNEVERTAIKPHITKWRSAEQQCIEIEKYFGNQAVDVSKKNIGYDIESITPEGKKRLIEVKSVTDTGEFAITNNEYTAAHQYGDDYYLCIMFQDDKKIKVVYINNPLETVHFEKRIRQWEWVCEEYVGESFTFEL